MDELCGKPLCPGKGKHTKKEHEQNTVDSDMEVSNG